MAFSRSQWRTITAIGIVLLAVGVLGPALLALALGTLQGHRMELEKTGVLFLAKLQAAIMAFVGLIAGILYSFGGAIYDVLTTGSVNSGTALAFLALIGMPILFAAFGFILGSIEAFIYNIVAGWFGGIEMDFR